MRQRTCKSSCIQSESDHGRFDGIVPFLAFSKKVYNISCGLEELTRTIVPEARRDIVLLRQEYWGVKGPLRPFGAPQRHKRDVFAMKHNAAE